MSDQNTGRRKAILAIVLLLAASLTAYLCLRKDPDKEISRTVFPDHTQVITYLPADQSQAIKLITVGEDGVTPVSGKIIYKDKAPWFAMTEDLKFRADGTLSENSQHYARNKDSGAELLRSVGKFAADGVTYVYHEVYRPDGTLERKGELLRPGNYQTTYFYEDGKSINRLRLFDSKKNFVSEKVLRLDGSTIAFTQTAPQGAMITTLYWEDDKMRATFTSLPSGAEKGEVYDRDGHTLLAEYERDPWSLQEIYHDAATGKLLQARQAVRMQGQLVVSIYSPVDFVMEAKQSFVLQSLIGPQAESPRLRRIDYWDRTNKWACLIRMNTDGVTPKDDTCPTKEGGTITRTLGDGGLITNVEIKDKNGKTISSQKPASATIDKINPDWLANKRPVELPSYMDKDAPPRLYDYR